MLDMIVGDIRAGKHSLDLFHGVLCESRGQDADQLGGVGFRSDRCRKVGIVDQVCQAQFLKQLVVVAVGFQNTHIEPFAVGAAVGVHDGAAGIETGLGILIAVLDGDHTRALTPDRLTEQRDHDLAALAGLCLLVESCGDPACQ